MLHHKSILVLTNFSESSDKALIEAFSIAEKFRSKVHILHTIDDIEQCAVDYCLSEEQILAEKNKLYKEAEKKMQEEIKQLHPKNTISIDWEIRFGHPYEELLNVQKEKDIDLIIAGRYTGRGHKFHLLPDLVDKAVSNNDFETLIVH